MSSLPIDELRADSSSTTRFFGFAGASRRAFGALESRASHPRRETRSRSTLRAPRPHSELDGRRCDSRSTERVKRNRHSVRCPRLWGGGSGKDKVLRSPRGSWVGRGRRREATTGCLNRLSALGWRIGGGPLAGRNRGTGLKGRGPIAQNVGNALTASGQPLPASLADRFTGRKSL